MCTEKPSAETLKLQPSILHPAKETYITYYYATVICLINNFTISTVDVYMAPEIYGDELFDRSVDIFSFGLILYEVSSF